VASPGEWVQIKDHFDMPAKTLTQLLSGVRPSELEEDDRRVFVREQGRGSDEILGELERQIARDLATSPDEVLRKAFALWGRSATDERDARAARHPSTKQHVSRRIKQELEEVPVFREASK